MSEENISEFEEVEKKSKKPKVLGIIIVLLLMTLTVTYLVNDTFKGLVNGALKDVPVIGGIISGKPTDEELDEREAEIARYYVEDLDPKSAADKLYIVKAEDSALHNRIVRRMNQISTQKTEKILEEVRNIEIRSDFLNDIYREVQDEKELGIQEKAKELESMSIRAAVDNIMEGSGYSEGEMEKLFLYLNDAAAADILYYLDGGTRSDILYKLSELDMKRKNSIEKLLEQKYTEEAEKDEKAGSLANIHTVANPKESAEVLGTDEEIDINILARTFMMMSEKVSAEILVNVEDKEFLDRLYAEIEMEEGLRGTDQSVLVLISQIRAYLIEYDEKINKLVKVYQRMNTQLAADSILALLANENELTVLQIREQDGYLLSDYIVAVDMMKKMRDANLKDIFEKMESTDVARITRILSEE